MSRPLIVVLQLVSGFFMIVSLTSIGAGEADQSTWIKFAVAVLVFLLAGRSFRKRNDVVKK